MKRTILAAIIFFWPFKSFSTTVIKMELEDLVRNSDAIFICEVLSSESFYDKNEKKVYTRYKFKIEKSVKSEESSDVFEIVQPGGVAGGIGMKVAGMPEFSEKERTLLFLKKNEPKEIPRYSVVGLSQGKFTIFKDESAGVEYAGNDLSGITQVEKDLSGHIIFPEMPAETKLRPLKDILAEIGEILKIIQNEKKEVHEK